MRMAIREFLALSVLFWLMAALPGPAVPDEGVDDDDGEEAESCGQQPDDAAQVAAVRAMADEQCDCSTATSHDDYVDCVDEVADAAVEEGSLRPECEEAVVTCAAQSTCGLPGFVTCCRTNRHGETTCSIKSDAADCEAPRRGTAFVGSTSSCCDACGAPGSTTTTTATFPPTTTRPGATTTTTTPGQTQCCVQSSAGGAFDTCTLLTPAQCSAQGGQDVGPGSCSPKPCPPGVPIPTTTTAPAETTTTTAPVETTPTTAPAETTTTEAVTTTTELPTTTTTAPGSPSGAFLDRPEALR
ncbi:MAG: hypothetical protein E6J57_08270 [Deltaproteobacteria bacterium]|nr:MAG: hypothetical protein E6J57_08270 [Deltaproteobacteria bacterium]